MKKDSKWLLRTDILIGFAVFALILSYVYINIRREPEPPVEKKLEAADGYQFEGKEFEHTDVQLKIVVMRDEQEFEALKQKLVPGVDGLEAFSAINPTTNTCTIYVKDPEWEYKPEFIGHELTHCIWGRWHNKRDKEETEKDTKNVNSTSK